MLSREDEYQISVSLGQAVNLAVETLNSNDMDWDSKELDSLVDFYFNYIKDKRKEVFARFKEPTPVYKPFPNLTPDEYESLPEEKKAELQQQKKDNNKVAYAEHKKVGKLRAKCPNCDRYGYQGEECRYCSPSVVGDRENMREVDPSSMLGGDGSNH